MKSGVNIYLPVLPPCPLLPAKPPLQRAAGGGPRSARRPRCLSRPQVEPGALELVACHVAAPQNSPRLGCCSHPSAKSPAFCGFHGNTLDFNQTKIKSKDPTQQRSRRTKPTRARARAWMFQGLARWHTCKQCFRRPLQMKPLGNRA